MKKPNTLDVPIASLGGILFLMKKGTNKVAPPIPTMPETTEKIKLITFEKNMIGQKLFAMSPLKNKTIPVEIVSSHYVDPKGERVRS